MRTRTRRPSDPRVEVGDIIEAAARCAWPARSWFGRLVRGERDWRSLAERATPGERAAILRDLGRRELLVCTLGGRFRLRQWLNARWAGAWAPPPSLRFYGDDTLLPAVEHALSHLPEPVADYVISAAYFIGVGSRLAGWTSPPLATAGLIPIVVSGSESDRLERLARHECGHVWHMSPEVVEAHAPTVGERAALFAYARREGWPVAEAEARAADDERLAQLCERAWTGPR
jgi:hypothetical protein